MLHDSPREEVWNEFVQLMQPFIWSRVLGNKETYCDLNGGRIHELQALDSQPAQIAGRGV